MAVEGSTVTSFVAVVRLLHVGVVSDHKVVLVAGSNWMCCYYRGCVIHTFANFWHSVFFQVCIVLLST